MATALNTFRTVTAALTTNSTTLYTTPLNTTTIVLLSQCSNITTVAANVTASHFDGGSTTTELVKNFPIPPSDAVGLVSGKLVLTAGQSFVASASANVSLKLTLSLLETK